MINKNQFVYVVTGECDQGWKEQNIWVVGVFSCRELAEARIADLESAQAKAVKNENNPDYDPEIETWQAIDHEAWEFIEGSNASAVSWSYSSHLIDA